jgi:hypothetical protein
MNNRIYYYGINGKQEPDHESMAAFLLDEGVLFISPTKDIIVLCVLINDYFVPAADAEPITYDEIPILYELYLKKQNEGVCEFVANKRGIENKHWKEVYKNNV